MSYIPRHRFSWKQIQFSFQVSLCSLREPHYLQKFVPWISLQKASATEVPKDT